MRILFITQDDPFYVKLFFEKFFEEKPDTIEVQGVVICPTMGKKSLSKLIKQMYAFYGFIDFIRMLTRYLKVKLSGSSLDRLCARFGIPVYHSADINAPSFLEEWHNKNIDVIVSIAAPVVFKKALLDLPGWGCLNIHHAPLPRYRGMMPNFWQMFHGEKSAAITIHRMNEKLDEGDILLQRGVPFAQGESLDELIRRTKKQAAHYMLEALQMIVENKAQYTQQPCEKGSYFSFPARQDVALFRKKGFKLL